jgi:hypothetical protein
MPLRSFGEGLRTFSETLLQLSFDFNTNRWLFTIQINMLNIKLENAKMINISLRHIDQGVYDDF